MTRIYAATVFAVFVTTSLATAQLLAAQIAGGATAIPIEPYLPARFALGVCHA